MTETIEDPKPSSVIKGIYEIHIRYVLEKHPEGLNIWDLFDEIPDPDLMIQHVLDYVTKMVMNGDIIRFMDHTNLKESKNFPIFKLKG